MGDMTDYILSTCDPFNEEWPGEYYGEPTRKVCRYCNLGGLHWGMTDKGWRLFGDDNKQHRCQPNEAKQRFLQQYGDSY